MRGYICVFAQDFERGIAERPAGLVGREAVAQMHPPQGLSNAVTMQAAPVPSYFPPTDVPRPISPYCYNCTCNRATISPPHPTVTPPQPPRPGPSSFGRKRRILLNYFIFSRDYNFFKNTMNDCDVIIILCS